MELSLRNAPRHKLGLEEETQITSLVRVKNEGKEGTSTLTERANVNNASRRLMIERVTLRKHLVFNLYEFNAFRKSEQGNAFEFPIPRISVPFVVVPYFAVLEVILFRARRYFVLLDNRIVGLFAVEPRNSLLIISNLAVVPEARRHGIGVYMLDQICRMGAELGLKSLRLRVLKKNRPAQRLYVKYGFVKKSESQFSLKLEKRLRNH